MPSLGRKSLNVSEETHHAARIAAAERRMTIEQLVGFAVAQYLEGPPAESSPDLKGIPRHRQPLVKAFLAWWEGKHEPVDRTVKLAFAKLAQADWVIPEIEKQGANRE